MTTKALKLTPKIKKLGKQDRERKVLLGLVEYYIETGKPVGSNTLKETGFDDLSSATIRNYFAHLEEEGYLSQQHISGGRVPTEKAFRLYAHDNVDSLVLSEGDDLKLHNLREQETKNIAAFLQQGAELLSNLTHHAVFLSAPRFDHDMIISIRLLSIDIHRCLCVMVTDFGVIKTEVLQTPLKLSAFAVKRIESYFQWRLTGLDKPGNLEPEEEQLALRFYNEIIVRYLVGYSTFIDEEVYRTGLSKLIAFSDFQDPAILANSLALFENAHSMRLLLRECSKLHGLKFWIGEDLTSYTTGPQNCAVIAVPYCINQQPVGAIGLLCPMRTSYPKLFGLMRAFADNISEALTRSIYKYKISYRQPHKAPFLIEQGSMMLLEDKSIIEEK